MAVIPANDPNSPRNRIDEFDRAYAATRILIADGVHPGPTAVNDLLQLEGGRHLNGAKTRARRAAMEDAGFTVDSKTGRWHAPPGQPRSDGFIDRKNRFWYGRGFHSMLTHLHNSRDCAGRPCVVHDPSNHSMRGFPLHWRQHDGWINIKPSHFERICPHGVGHPDPDDLIYHVENGDEYVGVHGCDGCCA